MGEDGEREIIFITNRTKCFWCLEDKDSVAISIGLTISQIINNLLKVNLSAQCNQEIYFIYMSYKE